MLTRLFAESFKRKFKHVESETVKTLYKPVKLQLRIVS